MRAVLALERAPDSPAALDPALRLAHGLGASLAALFVEDPALLPVQVLHTAARLWRRTGAPLALAD